MEQKPTNYVEPVFPRIPCIIGAQGEAPAEPSLPRRVGSAREYPARQEPRPPEKRHLLAERPSGDRREGQDCIPRTGQAAVPPHAAAEV